MSQVQHLYPKADIPNELAGRIKETIDLRNSTIHYEAKAEQLGPHPIEGLTTNWVMRTYTCEAAYAAVETLADVVSAALTPGSSSIPEAEWFAKRHQGVGGAIRDRSEVPVDVTP